jgi:hypothetical protein
VVAHAGRQGGWLRAREAAACHRGAWAVTAKSVLGRGGRPMVEGGSMRHHHFLVLRQMGKRMEVGKNWGPNTLLMGERGGGGPGSKSGGPASCRRAGAVEVASGRQHRGPPHVGCCCYGLGPQEQ